MKLFHFIAEHKIKSNFSASDIVKKTIKEFLNNKEIIIEKDCNGKPKVLGKDDIFISVSHSGNHAVLAICDCKVGVDIEILREIDFLKIAKRYFSKKENEYILKNGANGFFEIWTRKEARIKCFNSKISECVIDNPYNEKSILHDGMFLSLCSDKEIYIEDIVDIGI